MKYFTYEFKKACNLGKIYILPKIHKRLSDVPGRPVISNCGMPAEKVSEFLDYKLKPVMQKGKSYITNSGHFLEKNKNIITLPENTIPVTTDVVSLYPSIPHEAGLSALKEALEHRFLKIPTENLIKMAEFVLNNNLFEFNNKVFQQISGTTIGANFAPRMHAFTWIELSKIFQKHKNYNHCCGLGSLTKFFSFGLMERKN